MSLTPQDNGGAGGKGRQMGANEKTSAEPAAGEADQPVVGYVGEDLKPQTWYLVSKSGAFVEVEA